jgi:hypothetical protein
LAQIWRKKLFQFLLNVAILSPELAIHVRGKEYPNLLAIEAKRDSGQLKPSDKDYLKLTAFTNPNGAFKYLWGARGDKGTHIRLITGRPAVVFEFLVDIARVTFVENTVGIFEVLPEESLVHGLDENVQAAIAAIEGDACERDAGRGHASIAIKAGAKVFREEAAILAGVVEHDLVEAAVALAGLELVEVHGQAGFIVERPEAAFALEAHPAVAKGLLADRDRGAHISLVIAPKLVEFGRCDIDFEMVNGGVGKEFVAGRARVSGRRGENG